MRDRFNLRDEGGANHEVAISGSTATIGDREIDVRHIRNGEFRVGEHRVWAAGHNDKRWVFVNGSVYAFDLQRPGSRGRPRQGHDAGLSAPMPATVVKLHAAPGDHVQAGQLLVVLEAMKMELPVRAATAGRVDAVHCAEGELVQPGEPLLHLTPDPPPSASEKERR
jgi:biotin carboxyl carrier protein